MCYHWLKLQCFFFHRIAWKPQSSLTIYAFPEMTLNKKIFFLLDKKKIYTLIYFLSVAKNEKYKR